VDGFSLSNSSCVYNAICNQNATCSSCPYGYYLTNITNMQGVCAQCPNITNCLACNPLNSTSCFLCDAGFFATTAGACLPCSTGCAQCSSTTYCTLAASGYYLTTTSDGSFSGQTRNCSFPCLTCDLSPNFCLSCVTGYSITGTMCFNNNIAQVTIIFNMPSIFGSTDSFDVAYGKVLNNIGYFRTTICANLPKEIRQLDLTCSSNFYFTRFTQGSIAMDFVIDISGFNSAGDAATAIGAASLLPDA
jgi:hypothetical protein